MSVVPEKGILSLVDTIIASYNRRGTLATETEASLRLALVKVLSGTATDGTLTIEPSALSDDRNVAPRGKGTRPAVAIADSIKDDGLVCLEDGTTHKILKRHLERKHGLTPAEYRAKWGLPADYPMTAPSYSKRRTELALEIGLGKKPTPLEAQFVETGAKHVGATAKIDIAPEAISAHRQPTEFDRGTGTDDDTQQSFDNSIVEPAAENTVTTFKPDSESAVIDQEEFEINPMTPPKIPVEATDSQAEQEARSMAPQDSAVAESAPTVEEDLVSRESSSSLPPKRKTLRLAPWRGTKSPAEALPETTPETAAPPATSAPIVASPVASSPLTKPIETPRQDEQGPRDETEKPRRGFHYPVHRYAR